MAASLFDESWYRVAALRPRLRSHAQIHRHHYRGALWYVLQHHGSGQFHRFTPVANAIIGLMDGERTVQEIWDLAGQRLGDDIPSQSEVIKLLAELHRADVLQADVPTDMREQHTRRTQLARRKLKQYIGNPMSLRFPLFDPDRMLTAMMAFMRPLFGPAGAALWCLTVLAALVLLATHWQAFSHGMADRVFSVENLLLAGVLFPLIKAAHELGHGLAVKARGGEVHEMGVMLLLFVPIPYVDASAASSVADKRWRMLVGAAGMLTELFIAAVAMILWTLLDPGVPRAVVYNIILITGVTTLLFNGNPLLRYDGYYILSDYLEIPNLGQRANDYVGYLVKRYAFRLPDVPSPVVARGERGWFVFYAVASFAYRMAISVAIALMVAGKFFLFGVGMALWYLYGTLLQPLFKMGDYLVRSPALGKRRRRALGATVLTVALALAALFWLPAPQYTRAEGVVWAPEEAQLRAQVAGELLRVVATPGQHVKQGQLLIESDNAELKARVAVQQAELQALEARAAAILNNPAQANIVQQQIVHARAALALAEQHLGESALRSPGDGIFIMPEARDAPGRYVERGALLGYVIGDGPGTVRVVVAQDDADLVRQGSRRIDLRIAGDVGTVIPARVLRDVPAATNRLPSMTLSLQGGGGIGLDPNAQGKDEDAATLQTLFVMDVALPPDVRVAELGQRVYLRFEHAPAPLGQQWYRSARRLFARKFNV